MGLHSISNVSVHLITPWNKVLLEKLSECIESNILRVLWNPDLHYRIHKSPSPNPILNQTAPPPIPLLKDPFSTNTLYAPLLALYVLHALPSHSSWTYYANNIWWWMQVMKLLAVWPSLSPCFRTSSAYVSPSTWHTKFHTHTKKTKKCGSVYLKLCIFL